MESLARVGMFVEGRTVKAGQSMTIGGKMGGNPIEDDADIRAMAGIDKVGEFLRFTVACRRRELRKRLVAP